ncbi:MAG: hypothetical protein M3017_07150 [Actinomycetota bacterium]|nr:hypothetical protein [Actinomycetota bacterium]
MAPSTGTSAHSRSTRPNPQRKGVTAMNVMPSISSIKRIFFSPIDQARIDRVREQHQRNIHQLNMMNIR